MIFIVIFIIFIIDYFISWFDIVLWQDVSGYSQRLMAVATAVLYPRVLVYPKVRSVLGVILGLISEANVGRGKILALI